MGDSFRTDSFDSSLHAVWDNCNVVMFGWIINLLIRDLSSSIMYSTSIYLAWKVLTEIYDKVNDPKLYQLHTENILVECYSLSRSILFIMTINVSVNFLWD